jgi:hypothetical protein
VLGLVIIVVGVFVVGGGVRCFVLFEVKGFGLVVMLLVCFVV